MLFKSIAVARLVEFLPSNPVARVRFPLGSGILISILALGVCPLTVVCPVLSLAVALTFCWPQITGRPTLVYLSSVLV